MGSGITKFLTQHCLYLSHMNIGFSREPQCSLQCPGNLSLQRVLPPLAAREGKRPEVKVRSSKRDCQMVEARWEH